jgi:2-polyprenyl-3-methyl-5-hydroxy-6-metoxy-1,4-benzoquinol methylase
MNETFDVIALWHSLEHLRNPWLVVDQAAKSLAPGGILVIAIPNIDSYQYSVLKGAWKHLDAPRHLFFFPIESLNGLCRQHGLSVLEVTTSDELSDALSRDNWHSLANSTIPVRYVRGVLARLMRLAAWKGERKPNAGAGLTAVFQLSAEPER